MTDHFAERGYSERGWEAERRLAAENERLKEEVTRLDRLLKEAVAIMAEMPCGTPESVEFLNRPIFND